MRRVMLQGFFLRINPILAQYHILKKYGNNHGARAMPLVDSEMDRTIQGGNSFKKINIFRFCSVRYHIEDGLHMG